MYDLKGQGLREGQCGGLVEIGGKASGRLSSERMGWLMFRVTVLKGDGQEKSKEKKRLAIVRIPVMLTGGRDCNRMTVVKDFDREVCFSDEAGRWWQ